jgi:hypothetical protein
MGLVSHTSRLERVDIDPCPHAIIACLASKASTSLQGLDIGFLWRHTHFVDVSFASFSSLRSLSIGMLTTAWLQEDRDILTPCAFPSLELLLWQGCPCDGFFKFLAFSSFPSIFDVEIRALSPLSPISAEYLSAFLHQNPLQVLSLTLHSDAELVQALPSVRAHTLMLMVGEAGFTPSPSFVPHIPPSTIALQLHAAPPELIMPVLEELEKTKSDSCRLETVMIRTTAPGKMFSWVPENEDPSGDGARYAAFLGRLLIHAAALMRRGIRLVDYKRMTVIDHFALLDHTELEDSR